MEKRNNKRNDKSFIIHEQDILKEKWIQLIRLDTTWQYISWSIEVTPRHNYKYAPYSIQEDLEGRAYATDRLERYHKEKNIWASM